MLVLQNSVDIKTVSSMLGHYDAGFTLRTYTHATRQKQDEAADTMGGLYGADAVRAERKNRAEGANLLPGTLVSIVSFLKCTPSQGHFHLTHCGSIPAGYSPVVM